MSAEQSTPVLQTARLRLTPKRRAEVEVEIAALSPADRKHLSADWLALLASAAEVDPWILGYEVSDHDGVPVGSCGFKGPPRDGVVEIAYCTHSQCEGRGYATEAAAALTAFAFSCESVRIVRAHTFAEENASASVLRNCGFAKVGPVTDPEDGLVWRWEKRA